MEPAGSRERAGSVRVGRSGLAAYNARFSGIADPLTSENDPSDPSDMVKIRLTRGGAKKRPFYHLVVSDSRVARDGRRIEQLGFYNPTAAAHEPSLRIDLERVDHWLATGAQTTERAAALISKYRARRAAEAAA